MMDMWGILDKVFTVFFVTFVIVLIVGVCIVVPIVAYTFLSNTNTCEDLGYNRYSPRMASDGYEACCRDLYRDNLIIPEEDCKAFTLEEFENKEAQNDA